MTILDKVHICISVVYELEAGFFLSQCKEPLTPRVTRKRRQTWSAHCNVRDKKSVFFRMLLAAPALFKCFPELEEIADCCICKL